MKKKMWIIILAMICVCTIGGVKGISVYKKHVMVTHLKEEITQSAGYAISYCKDFTGSKKDYNAEMLACELHHLMRLMMDLEDVQGETGWDGAQELRLAREALLLRGTEVEKLDYLMQGLEALEKDVESDGHGRFLEFYNINTH